MRTIGYALLLLAALAFVLGLGAFYFYPVDIPATAMSATTAR